MQSCCRYPEAPSARTLAHYHDRSNFVHVLVGVVGMICGMLSLWYNWNRVSQIVVSGVDLDILIILILVALRSDGFVGASKWLPHRLFGLLLFLFLLMALIPSFAEMYISRGDVCQSSHQHCLSACSLSQEASQPDFDSCRMTTMVNALYFSFVTMSTLGYGDYMPNSEVTRGIVVWQLGSGVLLFLLAFPMVVSRMAVW